MTLDGFETWLAAQGISSPHSRRAYLGHVRRYLASQADLSAWAVEQLAGVPAGTAGQIRSALRRYCEWAGQPVPTFPRGARRRRVERAPLSDAELARYYRQVTHTPGLRPEVRALLQVLPRTGLRISEACALQRGDVARQQGEWGFQVRAGKGGHARFVPLTSEARRIVEGYLQERGKEAARAPLFPGARLGSSLPPDSVRSVLRAMRAPSPHVLRHTFATRYWAATGDLLGLSEILGHASLETTRLYVQAPAAQKRRGMEAADLKKKRGKKR